MPDTTEQKIVTRALVVLAAIDGTGAYLTTLGKTLNDAGAEVPSVADSRPNWDQESGELPAISVFQLPVEVEDRDDEAQKVLRKMTLAIRGFIERGTDAATARKFLADIQRALRTVAGDKWIVATVPLATYTQESTHAIEYAPDTFEITGVEQQIDIYYAGSHMDLEA